MPAPSPIHPTSAHRRACCAAGQSVVSALLHTVMALGRCYEPVFAREGLTAAQYNVLRILRGAGEPLPTMEIADRMVEHAPGVTRLLDRLEEKALVARVRCAEDRRRVLCRITPEGLATLARLDADVDALDARAVEGLSEGERQTLLGLLERLRCACTA